MYQNSVPFAIFRMKGKKEKKWVFLWTDDFPRWQPYSHTILDPVQCRDMGCSRLLADLLRNVRQRRAFQLVQNALNAAV